jgi:arsenite-transporting ATPase
VGKTTLAAAVAIELARRGLPVHLTTSDPAAHLAETLEESPANLTVSRIDPHEETERYRKHVLDTKGAQLDAEGRALLEEDLRSPCTEEIAVFQAFSRIIREAGKKFVVMDTAPTGHTLLLLDAANAYHREVERNLTYIPDSVKRLLPQLRDRDFTKILIITLAEATPVHEAAQLQSDLQRAKIRPFAWVINQSFLAAGTNDPILAERGRLELRYIDEVRQTHADRVALIPWKSPYADGTAERLSELTGAGVKQL